MPGRMLKNGAAVLFVCTVLSATPALPSKAQDIRSTCFGMEEIFTPLERPFFEDLLDGSLDSHDYYDAFLIASGIVEKERFSHYRKIVESIRSKALSAVGRTASPCDRGKKLLAWLHDNIFKVYSEKATLAGDLIDKGEFNCLSSSILYCLLARDLGLSALGVITSGHAFCRISADGLDVAVETTNRYGFDPGRVESEPIEGGVRLVTVPKKVYSQTKTVDPLAMMAYLYVNTLDLSYVTIDGDSGSCLPRFAKACMLDPENGAFMHNLAACLNNLALSALDEGRLDEASIYIKRGKAIGQTPFDALEIQYYNQKAQQAALSRGPKSAVQILRAALRLHPGDPVLENNIAYYYERWADMLQKSSDTGALLNLFLEARQDLPESPVIRNHLKTAFYNHAADAYNKREFATALSVCRKGLALFPDDRDLLKILDAVIRAGKPGKR